MKTLQKFAFSWCWFYYKSSDLFNFNDPTFECWNSLWGTMGFASLQMETWLQQGKFKDNNNRYSEAAKNTTEVCGDL